MNRQESLFAILPRAKAASDKFGGIEIVVIHAPVYVDEHEEGEHVFCAKAGAPILYPQRAGMEWAIDAVIVGYSVFFTKIEDTLESIKRGVGKVKGIEIVRGAR